jgi:hypothetical protein
VSCVRACRACVRFGRQKFGRAVEYGGEEEAGLLVAHRAAGEVDVLEVGRRQALDQDRHLHQVQRKKNEKRQRKGRVKKKQKAKVRRGTCGV